jgi:hypothetical protein
VDISRLDYYRFLDIQIVASNFMELYIEICPHTPSVEELVAFATDRMGTFDYKDPQHYMYDYLLYLAEESLRELESKDS